MTDDSTKRPRRGRGYPPVEHQWQPGQSGNPRGRPRGAKNKNAAVALPDGLTPGDAAAIAEAHRTVTSTDGITLPTIAAIHRARNILAMKGNRLAAKDSDARLRAAEEKAQQRKELAFQNALEVQASSEYWHGRAAKANIANPPFYPHPDDIHLDWENLTFRIRGPATATEAREWDANFEGMAWIRQQIYRMRREVEKDPLDRATNYCLIRFMIAYDDMNDMLPERHQQPRLRPWPAARTLPPLSECRE
jgi:hypothetical protein